ncbi:chromate efflux transporter [Paenibacillus gansuensis]|uniref:Chromate efflux transporter n=1 Tax=Paenibacillus gansuensis TaxID=306542 RepID=A0ABW5PA54_9BACL
MKQNTTITVPKSELFTVFLTALKLGCTSFGGPAAHIGYFRKEYVERKRWLSENEYAEIVALCQFLPGPASSQVGMAIGMKKAGLPGSAAAWLGFTLPSAVLLILFALVVGAYDVSGSGWLHGLKIVAVVIVAQAVWGMGKTLAAGAVKGTIAIASAAALLCFPFSYVQLIVLAAAGSAGWICLRKEQMIPAAPQAVIKLNEPAQLTHVKSSISLVLFLLFFIGLPLTATIYPSVWLELASVFYRTGSLVFGGGHVVLPLLQQEVVPRGWLTEAQFVTGYGAAQAVPGPLFTFAAYTGSAMATGMEAVLMGVVSLLFVFLPSFLLVTAAIPYWAQLCRNANFQSVVRGINAGVVGILLAALYNPVWITAITSASDLALALVLFAGMTFGKLPPWGAVLAGAAGGVLLHTI